jgi:hypothetical protein
LEVGVARGRGLSVVLDVFSGLGVDAGPLDFDRAVSSLVD